MSLCLDCLLLLTQPSYTQDDLVTKEKTDLHQAINFMDDMCYGMLHISDIKKCRIIKKLHAGSLTMGFFFWGGGWFLKNLIHVLNILE